MGRITVYATKDKAVHDAIVALMVRKTGKKMNPGHVRRNAWLYVDNLPGLTGWYDKDPDHGEISLAELAAMPDYVEPPKVKEMTVADVSKLVGCPVKIVE